MVKILVLSKLLVRSPFLVLKEWEKISNFIFVVFDSILFE